MIPSNDIVWATYNATHRCVVLFRRFYFFHVCKVTYNNNPKLIEQVHEQHPTPLPLKTITKNNNEISKRRP